MNEQQLVTLCKNGDQKAFRILYDKYASQMMGVSLRYTGNRESSKDVLHDSFVKIIGSISRFEYRGPGSLGAWMSRIVVNTSLSSLKKNKYHLPLTDVGEMSDVEYGQESNEDEIDIYEKVSDEMIINCIGRLPEILRIVFNLFMFENIPHEDIAEKIGISEASSRVRLYRAKRVLSEMLKDEIKESNL